MIRSGSPRRRTPRSSTGRISSPTPSPGQSTGSRTRLRRPSIRRGPPGARHRPRTRCHDVTTYPELGLAAASCEGNGLLLDISHPANPRRLDAVSDPNYAYWHGATFSNDGKRSCSPTSGAAGPHRAAASPTSSAGARTRSTTSSTRSSCSAATTSCRSRRRTRRTASPTCPRSCRSPAATSWCRPGTRAACRPSTSPTPPTRGRSATHRGPISGTALVLGGSLVAHDFNGAVFGSEIARGLDSFRLTPTPELSANELTAADEVELERLTPQHQPRLTWAPSFAVVRSHRPARPARAAIETRTLKDVNQLLNSAEALADRDKPERAQEKLQKAAHVPSGTIRRTAALREADPGPRGDLQPVKNQHNGAGQEGGAARRPLPRSPASSRA